MDIDIDAFMQRVAGWVETDEDVSSVQVFPAEDVPGSFASVGIELRDGRTIFMACTFG